MTHHLSSTIKPLLGKKLLRFEINDPAKIFFTDGTEVTINITGDCCSTSIIYDVIQENNPHGTELIDVIEYDTSAAMPNAVEIAKKHWNHEGDCLSQWDIRFLFTGGAVLVRHLNNSNGYYDGLTDYHINPLPTPLQELQDQLRACEKSWMDYYTKFNASKKKVKELEAKLASITDAVQP